MSSLSAIRSVPGRVALALSLAAAMGACSWGPKGERDIVVNYTVDAGDSPASIAEDHYGDPAAAKRILRFNHIDAEEIAPGVKLRIPMRADEVEALEQRRAARAPYNEGLDLAARGEFLDATIAFRRAIELNSNYAAAHYNLGVTYMRMKAYKKARDSFEHAIDLKPDDIDYAYSLGSAYFHLESYDRAIAQFRRVIDADPLHARAVYSLATALEKSGRSGEARRWWERYLELDTDSAWADEARARLQSQ